MQLARTQGNLLKPVLNGGEEKKKKEKKNPYITMQNRQLVALR
jgi:hypothetical protein